MAEATRTRTRTRSRSRSAVAVAALVLLVTLVVALPREEPWQPLYREDFDAHSAAGAFEQAYGRTVGSYPPGWTDTLGTGTYQGSDSVTVADGTARVRVGDSGTGPVSTALVPQLPTYGQTYGRYEVRFRADPVPGYKVAFLLWPDSERWPDDGEIDFPEGHLDGTIGAFAHHADPAGTQDVFPTDATFGDWHTATVEWTPGRVGFWLDGEPVGRSTTSVPAVSMHWVLQVETTGEQPPAAGAGGVVEIDWVEAWSYRG